PRRTSSPHRLVGLSSVGGRPASLTGSGTRQRSTRPSPSSGAGRSRSSGPGMSRPRAARLRRHGHAPVARPRLSATSTSPTTPPRPTRTLTRPPSRPHSGASTPTAHSPPSDSHGHTPTTSTTATRHDRVDRPTLRSPHLATTQRPRTSIRRNTRAARHPIPTSLHPDGGHTMAYPANLTTLTATHKVVSASGRALKGNVYAVPAERVWATDGSIVEYEAKATIAADGTYELVLPHVDQAGIRNKGVPWKVTEDVPGQPRSFWVAPMTVMGTGDVDIATMLTTAPTSRDTIIQAGPVTDESMAASALNPQSEFRG